MGKKASSNEKVTITDIAKASAVSPATVSLVLRDKPGVGDDTRQRVLEMAQTLGYIPPATAPRQSPASALKHIGVVMKINPSDPPGNNHFYAPVVTGIEGICRQMQSNLLYANLLVDEHNQPLELPRLLLEQQIDGLLMIGMELTQGLLAHFQQRGLPIVLVDGYVENDQYDAVVTDNIRGGREATTYLIAQGHTQIALIGSSADAYPSIRERREGYIQAMTAHGLEPLFGDCALNPDAGGEISAEILAKQPDTTAFFACNDETAIGIMKKLKSLGRRVPEDISVIGFDNIVLAQHVTPALTTMRVDKMSMGRLAAQLLFNRLDYPMSSNVRAVIQPQLFERESVGQKHTD